MIATGEGACAGAVTWVSVRGHGAEGAGCTEEGREEDSGVGSVDGERGEERLVALAVAREEVRVQVERGSRLARGNRTLRHRRPPDGSATSFEEGGGAPGR